MEAVLVQGHLQEPRKITDRVLTCKGVTTSGERTLSTKILPPVHWGQSKQA